MLPSAVVTIFLVISSTKALAALLPQIHSADKEHAIRLLYQYPVGQWIENIAVRKTGELLLTQLYEPHLDQLNPFDAKSTPRTIATFGDYTALSGIAEIRPDVFVVVTGNTSESGPVSGSWDLWQTDLNPHANQQVRSRRIAKLRNLQFPNGLCSLPVMTRPNDVLTSDVKTGKIWRVDIASGQHQVVVDDELTADVPDPVYHQTGTDGIRIQGHTLYFANAGTGVFASISINDKGAPQGPPKIIYRIPNNDTGSLDDFAVKGNDAYLVNARGNSIVKVGLDGTPKGRIIAGNLNSTEIAQPTSCAFGRTPHDQHILYVVTAGGLAIPVNGNTTVGAQILAIDTKQWDMHIEA